VADERKDDLRRVFSDGLRATRGIVVWDGDQGAHVQFVPDNSHRLATAKEILDRLHGKPAPAGEMPTQMSVNFNLVSDHALRERAADLRRDLAAERTIEPGRLGHSG